ncbi:hypothetical protein JW851_01780 [Candidatus Woesearchaeota archaeon]|nr:hypothetical protein [Candidatus Woesearchaeota archaeon]
MGRRKTTGLGEKTELLVQKTDRRTAAGRTAAKAIFQYYENSDGKTISLLYGIIARCSLRNITELNEIEDVFYVSKQKEEKEKQKEICVCGTRIQNVYLLQLKNGKISLDEILESLETNQILQLSKDLIPIGKNCYEKLPEILSELGLKKAAERISSMSRKKTIKKAKKDMEAIVNELTQNISFELRQQLRKAGIQPEQLARTSLLIKHYEQFLKGDESGTLFDLDPGSNRSMFNWFEENAKDSINKEIRNILRKCKYAAHRLNQNDLAQIMLYIMEYKQINTNVMLAEFNKDMLYISSLPFRHPWVTKKRIRIDKRFSQPNTIYRNRRSIRGRTIRKLLEQERITAMQAMGIHNKFPFLEQLRISINTEIEQKYGSEKEISSLIQSTKDYYKQIKEKRKQEVFSGKILFGGEYGILKEFFKRASVGRTHSEQENYLRNFCIEDFQETFPLIILIGRKIKYARKLKKENSRIQEHNILRTQYILKEEIDENFEKLTGISEKDIRERLRLKDGDSLFENLLDFFEKVPYSHSQFTNFWSKNILRIQTGLSEGIVEKKYFAMEKNKNNFSIWYERLMNAEMHKISDESIQQVEALRKLQQESGTGFYYLRKRIFLSTLEREGYGSNHSELTIKCLYKEYIERN